MARKNWGAKLWFPVLSHPSVQRPIRALKDRGFEVVEILPEQTVTWMLPNWLPRM